VLGYNTYKGLCESWPGDKVLPGRDVVVLYKPTDETDEHVEQGRLNALMLPINNNREAGGRLIALALPNNLNDSISVMFMQCLLHDIYQFAQPNQLVYIAGGSKTYEMFAPFIKQYEVTVVTHQNWNSIDQPIYLGSKTRYALTMLTTGIAHNGHAIDDVNNTQCEFYTVQNYNQMLKIT
jgi:dihydrofolate reductase